MSFMDFGFFRKRPRVNVSSVNVRWKGSMHSLGSIGAKGKTFDIDIPFQNKTQEDYNFLNTQKKPPVKIKDVQIKEPFKLIEVSPKPPISIGDGERVVFKVKVGAPDVAYDGPMNVELVEDSADTVHIEISKIRIVTPQGVTELKDRPAMMDLPRGLVFRQNIHLYGAVGFGTTIRKIEISPPFAFVSSDPKVPFAIDNKTGYLIDLYIQAPPSSYGGPLEISVS